MQNPADLTAPSPSEQAAITLHGLDIEVLASTLRAVAKGFFAIYVVVMLLRAIPIRWGDLAWLQGLISEFILNAAIPLAGFGFLLLAALIAPTPRTVRLLLMASRIALPAAIGFLLLIPTQGYVTVQALQRSESTAAQQGGQAQKNLSSLRDRVEQVRSSEELAQAIAGLPQMLAQRLLALPLPQARKELVAGIDRDAATLRANMMKRQSEIRFGASRDLVRTTLLSLVLARVLYCGRENRIKEVFLRFLP